MSKLNSSTLKSLLLAGAVIPGLVCTPMQPSFAQAPDEHPRGPGPHGPREGGPGPRGPRDSAPAARGPHEGQPGLRGEGGPGMRGPREGGPGMREGAPGPRGAGREPGEGPREGAPHQGAPHEGAPHEAPGAERHGPPAAERGPTPGGGPAEPGAERRAQHRQDRDNGAPRNGLREDNGGPGTPGGERQQRMGNNPNRGPGERGPNDRGPGERGPGERGPGGIGERGPGERGPGERGPGGIGERGPDDRGLDRDRRLGENPGRRDTGRPGGLGPAGAAAVGAAAGFAGGFMAGTAARRIDDIRRDRREVVEGGRTFIREPGRTIIEDGNRRFLVHDPNDRFRELGYRIDRQRRGDAFVDTVALAGGVAILTFTTPDGRLLRRVRRGPDGREVVLFENGFDGGLRPVQDDVVILPPPPLRIPRDRYVVDYADVDEGVIYDTLIAPPLAPPPARYTLDQVLYSPDIRNYVRSIDINTINFDTGSWIVPGDQTGKLRALAQAINRAVDRNPNSVFLIEGYTDATGNPTDNLSLSDRRAQSVAAILTKDFNVPPENLTTQGYGDQNPKDPTSGSSAANRRVVVRNITQLLASGGAPPQ